MRIDKRKPVLTRFLRFLPEPGTLALFAAGGMGLGLVWFRRRKNQE
jgi:hypothetical protein